MSGETHMAVGIATALFVVQPTTPKELIACMGVAAIGATVCDLDSKSSKSHREFVKSMIIMIGALCVMLGSDLYYGTSLLKATLLADIKMTAGIAVFLAICIYGSNKPHRTFLHSWLVCITLSTCVWFINPTFALPFLSASISHTIIDLVNKKRVHLFYPLDKNLGISLNLVPACGRVNKMLGTIATMAVVCEATLLMSGSWFW